MNQSEINMLEQFNVLKERYMIYLESIPTYLQDPNFSFQEKVET